MVACNKLMINHLFLMETIELCIELTHTSKITAVWID